MTPENDADMDAALAREDALAKKLAGELDGLTLTAFVDKLVRFGKEYGPTIAHAALTAFAVSRGIVL